MSGVTLETHEEETVVRQGEGPNTMLVGDVGGTHLRLALARRSGGRATLSNIEERVHGARVDLAAEVIGYVARQGAGGVEAAVLAVAGPVVDGAAALTNAVGHVSEASLSRALGGIPVRLLNDFEALAMASPALGAADLHRIGPVAVAEGAAGTVAILGPGTGLGVSAMVRDGRGEAVAVTEGGHIGFAPTDETEVEVWRALTAVHGRCSLERILCGPGMVALHEALGGRGFTDPAALLAAANDGEASAAKTVERFCAILGSAAGDAALTFGARGGVLLGGGISPRLIPWLERGGFRERFEGKGRFESYLAAIPTAVITHPHAALLGAARAFG